MAAATIPARLHHTALVTKDMEATRKFYEEIIGLKLATTFCESDMLFGKERTYIHCFFEMADGSSLAFFQFADPEDQKEFGPEIPVSPFNHVALYVDKETQKAIEKRIAAAGYKEPDTYILEHGYCRSVYVYDPNRMIVELCYDDAEASKSAGEWRAKAHAELKRWLAGDYTSNNFYR